MGRTAKIAENLTGHRAGDELEARAAAEAELMPARAKKLKASKAVKQDPAALRAWRRVLKDSEDVELLDVLDADTLATYCLKLSRLEFFRDRASALRKSYDEFPDGETLKLIDGLEETIRKAETAVLDYAGKLGLTPASRAALARKRAQAQMDSAEHDLFGD